MKFAIPMRVGDDCA